MISIDQVGLASFKNSSDEQEILIKDEENKEFLSLLSPTKEAEIVFEDSADPLFFDEHMVDYFFYDQIENKNQDLENPISPLAFLNTKNEKNNRLLLNIQKSYLEREQLDPNMLNGNLTLKDLENITVELLNDTPIQEKNLFFIEPDITTDVKNIALPPPPSLNNSNIENDSIFTECHVHHFNEVFPVLQKSATQHHNQVINFPVQHPFGVLEVRLKFQRGSVNALFLSDCEDLMELLGQHHSAIKNLFVNFSDPIIRFHKRGS